MKTSPQDFGVPEYMVPGLMRYIDQGVLPGTFLTAVLENDLRDAIGWADDTNVRCLPAYVHYLYNEAPSLCWGSPEKVRLWVQQRGQSRAAISDAAGEPS